MVSTVKEENPVVETALKAADSALLLQAPSQISRAAKAWNKARFLGVDTEFVRERTYYANLGLVQVSDGQTVWLVDPQIDGSDGALRELLENTEITKIFHSPSEDLEVLLKSVGALPQPMIDTQIACALLGQPLQLAYHAMVRWLLAVNLDNDQTRSNWTARPLKPAQLHYAALDVCLLPEIWRILEQKLRSTGRLEWFFDDCKWVISNACNAASGAPGWTRLRGAAKLDGKSLALLDSLYEWREAQARARNLPRGFVVKDPVLLNIAVSRPDSVQALQKIEGLHPGTVRRYADSLLETIRQARESGRTLPRIQGLTKSERDCLAQMKNLVAEKAQKLGIEPAVIASRRELEEILRQPRDQWPAKFRGWRDQLVGDELEAACRKTG